MITSDSVNFLDTLRGSFDLHGNGQYLIEMVAELLPPFPIF
jgi:hypothetical protein